MVQFRPRGAASTGHHGEGATVQRLVPRPPVKDIGKYERAGDDDDYRHRMTMNVLALGVCVLLALVGVWIADQMATMRKNQDCVLSGRPGCTKIEVPDR